MIPHKQQTLLKLTFAKILLFKEIQLFTFKMIQME